MHSFFLSYFFDSSFSKLKLSNTSNFIGTCNASKIVLTLSKNTYILILVISGPIPTPGIKVTFFKAPSPGFYK